MSDDVLVSQFDGFVINAYKVTLEERTAAEYIGRPSKLGNPIYLPPKSTAEKRLQVLDQYEWYLRTRSDLFPYIRKLRGRKLCCFCAPKTCHGHILAYLANCSDEEFDLWVSGVSIHELVLIFKQPKSEV